LVPDSGRPAGRHFEHDHLDQARAGST
jgi:hypothetical protein